MARWCVSQFIRFRDGTLVRAESVVLVSPVREADRELGVFATKASTHAYVQTGPDISGLCIEVEETPEEVVALLGVLVRTSASAENLVGKVKSALQAERQKGQEEAAGTIASLKDVLVKIGSIPGVAVCGPESVGVLEAVRLALGEKEGGDLMLRDMAERGAERL